MLIARLKASAFCGILVLSLNLFAFSQTPPESEPRDVQVCELLRNPRSFDRQLVRFRGQLDSEFEDNTVNDPECGLPLWHTGIWWSYGDEVLHTASRRTRPIQPLVSLILRDTSFETFEEHAHLRRTMLPDGQPCRFRGDCAYYDVVATFTGKFFAGERPPRRRLSGFGHMGCCHLFVIEKISDVVVQRTPVPPDDQAFSCTATEWQSEYPATAVSSFDERVRMNRQFLMDQARSHGDAVLADKIKTDSLQQFVGLTGTLACSSPDLLTTYTATFPQPYLNLKKKRHKQTEPPSPVPPLMNVSRERCEPVPN